MKAHHHVSGPQTERNSGGKRIIKKLAGTWLVIILPITLNLDVSKSVSKKTTENGREQNHSKVISGPK